MRLALGLKFSRKAQSLPEPYLAPDLALVGQRRVLLYGDLPEADERELLDRGVELRHADSALDVLRTLALAGHFDVLACAPERVDTKALVRSLLVSSVDAPDGVSPHLGAARRTHCQIPLVLLPFPDDDEFAVVIDSPRQIHVERVRPLRLANVLRRLSVPFVLS